MGTTQVPENRVTAIVFLMLEAAAGNDRRGVWAEEGLAAAQLSRDLGEHGVDVGLDEGACGRNGLGADGVTLGFCDGGTT